MDIKTKLCIGPLWTLAKYLKPAQHPFNEKGDIWENLYLWQYNTTQKTLNHFKVSITKKSVLDIGCGTGGKSAYLASLDNNVIGIDINPHSIAHAKRLIKKHHPHVFNKVDFKVDNAYALSLPDNSVDIIFMDDVWEHIDKPSRALKEAIRVVKPGGYILIAFPPLNHPWAAHVNDLIPIPWIHYCLWEKYIVRWYILEAIKRDNGIDRLKFKNMKPYDTTIRYINHMTLEKTLAIFLQNKEAIDIVDFSYDLLKLPGAKFFSKLKPIGWFFFSKYYFTLQKREQP